MTPMKDEIEVYGDENHDAEIRTRILYHVTFYLIFKHQEVCGHFPSIMPTGDRIYDKPWFFEWYANGIELITLTDDWAIESIGLR